MCGACWTHRVDEEPWCPSCVAVLEQPVSWLAYAAGAVLAIGLSWIGLARLPSPARWIALGIGVSIVSLTAWRLRRRAASRRAGFVAQVRAPDSEPPRGPPMGYRQGRAPLRARRLAPPVSGSLTALIVGSTMALTAFAFPSLLQLPRWLELELVIALWWGVWTLTFVILLYRGWRVARDLAPTGAIRAPARVAPGSRSGSSRWTWADVFAGALDLDGCLVVLAVAAAFGVAFVIAELILPMLLTGAYWLIVRGLTSVANDDHGCERSWPRALAWGALWSTAYTAPLAALVWLGHWLLRA
ncbi:MAG TPA: hypothetical protein DEF51_35030 [Myxococcales bacterium]|nr:hypothetical protein [Myxococcales bacterium]